VNRQPVKLVATLSLPKADEAWAFGIGEPGSHVESAAGRRGVGFGGVMMLCGSLLNKAICALTSADEA
jgi:hypothetical protein